MTQHIAEFRAPNAPVNLFDTRGFEAGDDAALTAVRSKLDEVGAQADVSAHVHIAWLCIASSSGRIEPAHRTLLSDLAERKIPCIVVLTKTTGDSMLDIARELAQPSVAVIELLAEPQPLRGGAVIEAFGLGDLVDSTYEVVPEGLQQAFSASQQSSWALKKVEARKIVHQMALQAGGHGANPIPLADAFGVYQVQKRMLARIDHVFGLTVEDPATSAIRAHATGWISGLGSLAKKLLPKAITELTGVGIPAGMAAGAATSAAATTALGYAYVEAISRYLPNGKDLPAAELVDIVLQTLSAARQPPPAAA